MPLDHLKRDHNFPSQFKETKEGALGLKPTLFEATKKAIFPSVVQSLPGDFLFAGTVCNCIIQPSSIVPKP